MSTQLDKAQVRPNWDTKRMQQAVTQLVAHKIASRLIFLQTHEGTEIDELEKEYAQLKADTLKLNGVNTPMALVKYLAEHEVNLFGSDVSVGGNEQQATLFIDRPVVWIEAKRISRVNREAEMKAQKHYRRWIEHLAQFLGFRVDVDIASDGNSSRVTFSR